MFRRIMIPVDLGHIAALERALQVAADLSGHYGAEVVYVGLSGEQPSNLAHNPEEYAAKLDAFAKEDAAKRGVSKATAHPVIAHDPAVEIDTLLTKTVTDVGADLVVMGSHIPRRFEMGSHGGRMASHTPVSVMLVRDAD
ncbi:universal stress protein [Nioella nitratireducens]|uniref:universal stress protein n=1 Tax=Nioella nitratireducens TaxID=1287720 RepID=UPI0008FD038C|nr:universal stress protein [Nioella nitratireducens]